MPWRKKWQPTTVLLPGEPSEQRRLAIYSPWGSQESDTLCTIFFSYQKLPVETTRQRTVGTVVDIQELSGPQSTTTKKMATLVLSLEFYQQAFYQQGPSMGLEGAPVPSFTENCSILSSNAPRFLLDKNLK